MMQLRLLELCHKAGVHLLMCCEACDARMDGGRLTQVTVFGKNHSYDIEAKVFIDATGDGELSQMAGVPMVSRENDGELQPASLIFALSNVKREPLLEYLEQNPDEAKTPEGYEMETSPAFYRGSKGYNVLGLDYLIRAARANGDYKDIPRDRFSTITNPLPDRMTINNTRIMNFDGSDLFQLSKGIERIPADGRTVAFYSQICSGI